MNAVSVDFDYLEPKEWQRSWIKGEREGTTSSDLYIAPEIYKDELDGALDVYLLALFFTRRTASRTSPAQWPQSARHARSTSSGNHYDRHWDTPISVNVRANVDIVFVEPKAAVLCVQWCPNKSSVFGSSAEDGGCPVSKDVPDRARFIQVYLKSSVQQLKESISISVGLQANPDNVTLSVQRLDNNIGEKDKESVDASK
ncbi:hypothetical protein Tco_0562517 [Tanacetum coccineum]